mmetsp:Transcript_17141/g.29092  ORF Transcript_17141/g.29092 Transcript_17141/m.29092 type:complete len:232 (+) Transcript_17141:3-698(+)
MLQCAVKNAASVTPRRLFRPDVVGSLSVISQNAIVETQTRGMVTKRRVKLQEKRRRKAAMAAKGILPPKPPNYIPKETPVINSQSREEREAEARAADVKASQQMQERMKQNELSEPLLRYHMEGLTMSDRVRKLFDLTNGNQGEVVKAQKQRGMELFQARDGDTGSSAVQVIALTTRIQQVQTHLASHRKDNSAKRGLEALYVRRRKLLDYMERKDFESYRRVVKTLGLTR